MLKNYFRIVIQNLIRHKSFSLINILGLAIGIACGLILMIWVNHEFSYDNYHKNIDRISTVLSKSDDDKEIDDIMPFALSVAAKRDIPEVEAAVPYLKWNSKNYIQLGEQKLCFAFDYSLSDFFKIFSFDYIEGSAKNALVNSNSIVITQKVADALFKGQSALGKSFLLGKDVLEISAVIKDNPTNSQFQFDILANIFLLKKSGWDVAEEEWNTQSYRIYMLQKEDGLTKNIEDKLNALLKQNGDFDYKLFLYPFKDLYVKSPIGIPLISTLRIFIVVGILIILIACINYINLSTARYSQRLKEIGVRKIFGANRKQIAMQQFGESFLYAAISTYIGILLADIFLPVFNYFTGVPISFPWSNSLFWVETAIISIVIAFATGVYPAYILSSFKPVDALKNVLIKGQKGEILRNYLVLFQFTCTIFFIICAMTIAKQNIYISIKDLGFTRENVVYTFVDDTLIARNYNSIKEELLKNPIIKDVTRSRDVPFEYGSWSNTIAQSDVESNFFDFFEMPLVSGQTFSKSRRYEWNDVIINETLQKLFNNKSEEVAWIQRSKLNIIGVVKDYHIQSLKNPIKPLVIRNNIGDRFQLFIKYQPQKSKEAVELINNVLDKFSSSNRNDLFFMDEMIMKAYDKEKQQLFIYIIFSIITIFISCLGLVGLTIYSVERREKEIAIRKANGAKTIEIVKLFVGLVCKWVLASFLIAIIPSYLIMQKWLQNFSYKTQISWWIFALSLAITLIIAVSLTIWLTLKSASKNPVEALRYE